MFLFVLLLFWTGSVQLADAEVVCGWHFNSFNSNTALLEADHGAGLIDGSVLADSLMAYAGTELNHIDNDPAGFALGVRGKGSNGLWLEVSFVAQRDARLSFAYRSSTTGFDENSVQLWTGSSWSTLGTFGSGDGFFSTGDPWAIASFDLHDLEDESRIRIVLGGARSTNGTIRFDNLHVSYVPAPGALALIAIASLIGDRGRPTRSRRRGR